MNKSLKLKSILITIGLTMFALNSHAVLIKGVEFPQGDISFADAVFDYSPVINSGEPTIPHQNFNSALGLPDYSSGSSCNTIADDAIDAENCSFVSLGDGGSITLQFINNVLTGSDSDALDLWIFEIGPDVEDTFVDISVDGNIWHSVGAVGGSTSGIDIDAYGFTSADSFSFVRLTDNASEGGQSGATVGADIDAVGAISTRRVDVNTPSTIGLMLLSLFFVLRRVRN
ncbi:hypothetical protein [Paraglaciecola sp.]|uniref:hypothetical protein n=1 Tax=Paraglaciecola sp. TaxID=1920173 RepID=UPI003EF8927D